MGGGTTQWMSPELLDPGRIGLKKSRPTKESDCYALGMVVYEVLSGQIPFAPSGAPVVIWKVLEGKRPGRPQGEEGKLFTDAIWGVLELCWKPQPSDRTSAKAVLLRLEGNPYPLRPSSNVGGDAETDSDGQSDTTASDRGTFYPFHPRSIFNYSCGTIGPPIENEPPHNHPPNPVSSTFSLFYIRLTVNHPRGVIGPPIKKELPDPPHNHPPSVASPDPSVFSPFHLKPQARVQSPLLYNRSADRTGW
jgi:hypothetical protein